MVLRNETLEVHPAVPRIGEGGSVNGMQEHRECLEAALGPREWPPVLDIHERQTVTAEGVRLETAQQAQGVVVEIDDSTRG